MTKEKRLFSLPTWARAVIAVVMSGIILLGFGSLMMDRNKRVNMLEGVYERSFYDLTAEVNDMEIKLDKLSVSNSAKYQRELLGELVVSSELAEANVAQLSQGEQGMEATSRFINQVGDYAKSLQKKVDGGEALSKEDKKSLDGLREVSAEVGKKLARMRDKIGTNYDFTLNTDGVGKDFSEIDLSIEYPELIYDGPFSDAVTKATPKGITDKVITKEEAYKIAKRAIGVESGDLAFQGQWEGKIKSLNYADGETTVKLALDGTLLMYNTPSSLGGSEYTEEQCVDVAKKYLETIGFSSMAPVWYSNYSGNVFVNFVYEQDGVLYYPDMVKVKVSAKTGKVVAFEGLAYAYNHTKRLTLTPVIDESTAINSAVGISVRETRLVTIPQNTSEVLAWEVFGEVGEKKYFIYIDALTGDEINILSVIDSEQGDLLI